MGGYGESGGGDGVLEDEVEIVLRDIVEGGGVG